eukprot:scaffold90986_cov36-Phaeocystis_antarctica.AAC.1
MSENSICESGCVPAARPRSIRRRIEPWPRQPGSLTRVLPGAAGLPGCCRGAAGVLPGKRTIASTRRRPRF